MVTQGDPLSVFFYAVASLPLISYLMHPGERVQTWFARDASASGHIRSLREWFFIKEHGPLLWPFAWIFP